MKCIQENNPQDLSSTLYYAGIEQEWNKNFGYLNFLCKGKAVIVDD